MTDAERTLLKLIAEKLIADEKVGYEMTGSTDGGTSPAGEKLKAALAAVEAEQG